MGMFFYFPMHYRILLTAALLLLTSFFKGIAAEAVLIEVDVSDRGRSINRWLYGINTAHWDESLFPGPAEEMLLTADRQAISLIRDSGVTLLKYPGGNAADSYIWNSEANSLLEMDTDEYIALCRATGAEPFITVNFNASPELAADWVRYCNVQKDYNVELWEIGDEQWGSWARGHGTPEAYAETFTAFARAMKAVDPTIKVAMNVPLGPRADNWTERVLAIAGEHVDLLTFTYFPLASEKETDEELLASSAIYWTTIIELREKVEEMLVVVRASEILYVNLGYNSVSHSPGPQTLEVVNALFVADLLGTMAETGTDIGCFWAIHNAYPPRGGDYGYLSSDGKNTPSYSYYVFPMFVNRFGDTMLKAKSSDPEVTVYASRDDEKVAVFLVNKNQGESKSVTVDLENFDPWSFAEVWILDENRKNEQLPDIPLEKNFSIEVPPYSLVAVNIRGAGFQPEPVNLALRAEATASSVSTIGPSFGPESAIDGLPHTRWDSAAWTKSDGKESQWIQLEWEEPKMMWVVEIDWGRSFGIDYTLEASADGSEWFTLAAVEDGSGGLERFEFDPIEVRFLRMNGTRGTPAISAYSIAEFKVFGPR